MMDGTIKFTIPGDDSQNMRYTLRCVFDAMNEKGYNPIILKDAEQWFYVVVASVETSDEASVILNKIAEDKSIVLREPYPCVLIPSNR